MPRPALNHKYLAAAKSSTTAIQLFARFPTTAIIGRQFPLASRRAFWCARSRSRS